MKDAFNKPEQDKALVKAVAGADIVAMIDALTAGADPNVRDPKTGRNLLFTVMDKLSSEEGKKSEGSLWAMFLALTQRGTSGSLADNAGLSPLHYGFDKGQVMLVSVMLLQPGCALNAPDPRTGDTPLHRALPLFVKKAADIDEAPFQMLLGYGADPLIPNSAGTTALDLARASNEDRAKLAVEKLMETPALRQRSLREKARRNPAKIRLP
jgi:hypothetical protein